MNNSPIVNIDSIIFLNGFFVIYIESFNLQTDGTSLLILFSFKDPKQAFMKILNAHKFSKYVLDVEGL